MAALLIAACQGPDEYFRGPIDAAGFDGPSVAGQGGSASGIGGGPGAGGMPTGLGGNGPGAGGNVGAAGSGTSGSAGTGGSPAGAGGTGGTAVGRGGTTGAGGTATGRGGTTGAGGAAGTTGRGGTTGAGGAAGATGRGGTTGAAGTTGTGGTTGSAGSTGTVLFSDDFESNAVGAVTATNWTRAGGSSSDWMIAPDGTKVMQQPNQNSATLRVQSLTGAGSAGSPWSGAVSVSARVKMIMPGNSNNNPAALLCVRYNTTSERYCGALVPGGVQILTAVGGTAGASGVFGATVSTGNFYTLRMSVDASNTLTVYLDGSMKGTYTPAAITNGTVAFGTAAMEAAFDDISVTRP